MLPLQLAIALLTFASAAAMAWHGMAAIAVYHLVFAVGIVPLILAAMVHFVPVLARASGPPVTVRALPIAALSGGLLVAGHFIFPQTLPSGHLQGGTVVMAAVLGLAYWTLRLRSKAIGTPHPCLDWYLAAMACLGIALIAILLGQAFPTQRAALRLLHLHLNTLGFIGITALGTLQVLLPTSAARLDTAAAPRMRRQLKWIILGCGGIAVGAAWQPALAWVGGGMLAAVLLAFAAAWLKTYRGEIFAWHGAAPSLAAAFAGYAGTLFLGAAHASQLALNPVPMFIAAFLLPLVTGAASQLLPLWLRPGRQTPWHQQARDRLGYASAARALAFLTGGMLLGCGVRLGWLLVFAGIAAFLARLPGLRFRKD